MVAQPLSMLANSCISVISVTRILVGSTALFTPQLTRQIFGIPITPETNIVARLFGVRELVIGAFLWSARGNVSRAIAKVDAAKIKETRRDVETFLYIGMLCDSADFCSSVMAVLTEGMEGRAIGLVGVGAAVVAVLGGVALRRL